MAGVLVIGYGNPLRGDDGAGRALAERLSGQACDGVRVVACHQLAPELAVDIGTAERVVLVDASTALAPGEVSESRLDPLAQGSPAGSSSHHLTPAALLGLSRELYGGSGEAWLVSIGVASIEPRIGLSAPVEDGLIRAQARVEALIRGS